MFPEFFTDDFVIGFCLVVLPCFAMVLVIGSFCLAEAMFPKKEVKRGATKVYPRHTSR